MATVAEDKAEDSCEKAAFYVLVNNPSNKHNLGTIIRCAVAFGAQAVVIVGADRFSTHGAHGSQKYIPVVHFYTFEQAVTRMRELGCRISGIAGTTTSYSGSAAVDTRPFHGPTAFIAGDLQHGELSASTAALCDDVLHISLPAAPELQLFVHPDSKLSIALHHFTAWAGYQEHVFQQHKYITRTFASEKERQLYMDARVREIRGVDNRSKAEASAETGEGDTIVHEICDGEEGVTSSAFGLATLAGITDY